MESRLEVFKEVAKEHKAGFVLYGDTLLVEELPKEEIKSKSGLIIDGGENQRNSIASQQPIFVRVLMVGAGHYEETEDGGRKDVPLDVEPGDILVIGVNSLTELSTFGGVLLVNTEARFGMTQASHALMQWRGKEKYDAFFKALGKGLGNGKG